MHEKFDSFCNQIDSLLSQYEARRLSSRELARYNRYDCTVGWLISTDLYHDSTQVCLALLIKNSFPYSRPLLFVHTPELKPLSYPHIESEGKLCIWSDRVIPEIDNCHYFIHLLIEAIDLLDKNFKGLHETHFHEEFVSYWIHHSKGKKYQVTCLCDPANRKCREVYSYAYGSRNFLIGDSPNELEAWLDNRSLLPRKKSKYKRKQGLGKIRPTALFFLESSWIPKEYPHTCGELINLLEAQLVDHSQEIRQLITTTLSNPFAETPCCLIQFNTTTGNCFAGIVFNQNIFPAKYKNSIRNGFRKEIPENFFQARFSDIKIFGAYVNRIDHDWVAGRDNNPHAKELKKCANIAIIGCGSVGSVVARLLVQAGIKNLILFDSDNLETENISRHSLGYEGVSNNKAEHLAYTLRRDFPYVNIQAINMTWQDAIVFDRNIQKVLQDAELIVSCTADWYSDKGLIALQSNLLLGPIVFAFTEAHAMAGHVVVNPCDSAAYDSLHFQQGDRVGEMKAPVTGWKNATLRKIPACGGNFQPYGIVPLTNLHALAAETVLGLLLGVEEPEPFRYVLFGSKSKLIDLKGEWSKEWCEEYGDPGNGRKIKKYVFNPDSSTWECRDC